MTTYWLMVLILSAICVSIGFGFGYRIPKKNTDYSYKNLRDELVAYFITVAPALILTLWCFTSYRDVVNNIEGKNPITVIMGCMATIFIPAILLIAAFIITAVITIARRNHALTRDEPS